MMEMPHLVDLSTLVQPRGALLDAGYNDNHIARLVRAKILHRIRVGAYVDHAVWHSLSPADQHRLRARAVLLVAHPTTVLTHVSSIIELGGTVWNIPLSHVHTTRTDGKAGRKQRDWIQHRGSLDDASVIQMGDVAISAPPRAAVEITTISSLEPSLATVNDLLHRNVMSEESFAAAAHRHRYWPNSLVSDLVVRLCNRRVESVGETRFDFFCWAQHLPRPVPQVEIKDESGRSFARVDFAWPEFGVFVEFDGRAKYALHRRPDESLEEFLYREKRREERISLVTGWVCIRISWADLNDPVRLAARIRAILKSRAAYSLEGLRPGS